MMKLGFLIEKALAQSVPPLFQGREVNFVVADSRKVIRGSVFVALQGAQGHGQDFINDAVEAGAFVVVTARGRKVSADNSQALFLEVDNPHLALVALLQVFYDRPGERMSVIGITGTNGKTTITYLLEAIFKAGGKSCGVIGTVNYRFGGKEFPAKNTTPALVDNFRHINAMAREGIEYCVMEVSSHALDQGRVDGIPFRHAVFSNLTGDHLDYHRDLEQYFTAKSKLFMTLPAESVALINMDDAHGARLVPITSGRVLTYGIEDSHAAIRAKDIKMDMSGSSFWFESPQGHGLMKTRLIGRHNVYNILAALGVGLSENIPLDMMARAIASFMSVPGRLERMDEGQPFSVFVDYAHTDDALKNVLTSLREISDKKIILVFGCGGDRDKTKRPRMGRAASELADEVIVTNDNPRSEDPQVIVDQIISGFSRRNYRVQFDRALAIREALGMAEAGDVVLIAGKGHEDYQIFKDKTIEFDERKIVRAFLRQRNETSHH